MRLKVNGETLKLLIKRADLTQQLVETVKEQEILNKKL